MFSNGVNIFLNYYQHLPEKIDPVAFSPGPFFVRWYSLMYLLAFAAVYVLLLYRIKKGEAHYTPGQIMDFLFYAFLGVLVGGRLGYAIFYNFSGYLADPWSIILPFNAAGKFIGFYGMSYHGGLIGTALASWLFVKKRNLDFWRFADFVVPAVSAGFFFGRIGNFLNGELYGRAATQAWGMYFPLDSTGILRHPSQLYEAFFEGLVLFLLFWLLRNSRKTEGYFLPLYLLAYGFFRFVLEFFREPDNLEGLVSGLTLGQTLSMLMMFVSLVVFISQRSEKTI